MYSVAMALSVSSMAALVILQRAARSVSAADAWAPVVQTVLLAIISLIGIWLAAHNKKLERKVDETKVEVDATKVVAVETRHLSNSAMGTSLEALVLAYEQLAVAFPDNPAYKAQLEMARKTLADHKIKEGAVAVAAGLAKSTVATV